VIPDGLGVEDLVEDVGAVVDDAVIFFSGEAGAPIYAITAVREGVRLHRRRISCDRYIGNPEPAPHARFIAKANQKGRAIPTMVADFFWKLIGHTNRRQS
jgi:hypothetical protein